MRELKKMTPHLQKFVDVYAGNIREAAEASGVGYGYARMAFKSHLVQDAIKARGILDGERAPLIASRSERQAFWSRTMNDVAEEMPVRLKASELLGKSECDFTEKRILEGGDKPLQVEMDVTPEIKKVLDAVYKPS